MYRPDFSSEIECANRLVKDYATHGNICVAFDYDNTLFDCHGTRPKNIVACLDLMKRCQEAELDLVVWTCSMESRFDEIKDYLNTYGIFKFTINSVNEEVYKFNGTNKKLFFSLLLDDRAGLGSAMRSLSLFLTSINE